MVTALKWRSGGRPHKSRDRGAQQRQPLCFRLLPFPIHVISENLFLTFPLLTPPLPSCPGVCFCLSLSILLLCPFSLFLSVSVHFLEKGWTDIVRKDGRSNGRTNEGRTEDGMTEGGWEDRRKMVLWMVLRTEGQAGG